MPVLAPKRLFNVEEYYRMAEARILREDDRVELIEGEIIEMTPIGSRHAGCVRFLDNVLTHILKEKAQVSTQNPIRIDEWSEPQPDIALLKPRDDFYRSRHPSASDILLVIEVADTSVHYDRENKIPLYGRAGIPEAWFVDLERQTIEQFSQPSKEGYQNSQILQTGQTISPHAFPHAVFSIGEIMGL
ncbi:MAG: Uma2 family endonuclease [Candidatus Hinthialibacter sp.]